MRSKTTTLVMLLLMVFALTSVGQSVELTPFVGYTFRSTVQITNGEARVNDGLTYGGAFTIAASKYNAIEISYYRYETEATAYSGYNSFVDVSKDVAVNYMLIGGQRLFPVNEKVTPFTGFNLGAGWLGSKDDSFSTITKFSMGFDAGVKIMVSEKVGLRLQTNFIFPITSTGGSFFWGSGGSGVGLTGYVPIWSFGFNGGLLFKIK